MKKKTLKHWIAAAIAGTALGAVGTATTVRIAAAQPTSKDPKERAKYYYDDGRKQFDLGNFQKAADSFKKAYEEWGDGAFLYNVASAYRQLDDCKQALFFYKRFLSVKKDAPAEKKAEVEGHIKTLETCVKTQAEIRSRPPEGTQEPDAPITGLPTGDGTTTPVGPTGTPPGDGRVATPGGPGDGQVDDGEEEEEDPEVTGQPKTITAHAGFGGAMIGAGDLAEKIPMQVSIALGAGYPIPVGEKLVIDAGVAIGFSPIPWAGSMMGQEGNASFTTIFANVGATFEVAPKILLRGELGGGVLLFGGLGEGNPFITNGTAPTSTLLMPAVRVGLTGEYAITKNIAAAITPVGFSYAPAKEGFKEEIGAFTRFEFTVGLGYRM